MRYFSALGIATAVIVVIVLVYYYTSTCNVGAYERYMYGLWTADDEFCADAGIASMLLFVGEPAGTGSTVTRPCYIIIADDVTSQPFDITYRTGWAGQCVGPYKVRAMCTWTDGDVFENGGAPVDFTFDMSRGTLVISGDDRDYARMYRQNDISNVLAVAPADANAQ